MKEIIIISWRTRRIIFSYECEDNTIKKTVEEAVRRKISLAFADLTCLDLSGVDLRNADLRWADLSDTNLLGADLRCSILNNVDLRNTDLRGANLLGAELDNADLDEVDLSNTKIDYPTGLPESEFIAWKKVYYRKKKIGVIIKLKILEDSKRSRATTDKCRCDKALVLEIQNFDGSKSDLTEVVNTNYKKCTYKVGEIVEADSWDENRFNECSHGIHFFLDRERALEYF